MVKLSDIYIKEIVSWNSKFNLTGLKSADEIRSKLYDDSLNISKAVDLEGPLSLIDIGCGAGFPGIPLKIEHPSLKLTLIDSVNKKIEFVKHVIELLGLKDATAICERAEVLGHKKGIRGSFDLAVSRAVAKLDTLCEYCLPFVNVGGIFVAQKGPDIGAELADAQSAIDQLGGRLKEQIQVASGYLVVIEKMVPTPPGFPRRTGMPSKSPL